MKKLFKKLSLVLLTVCAVFACAFAVSACGSNDTSTNYVFLIQNSDGSAFTQTDVLYQICTDNECNPLTNVSPDANGKLTLTQQQVNSVCHSDTDVTKFAFHVVGAEGYKYDCSFEIDGAKEYTCKLSLAE